MSDYTRSGTRRAGDDYQDLFALDLLVDWLAHPTRYQWARVEADEAGFLDDVLALRADGGFEAQQIKFVTDAEDENELLTWDFLLSRKVGKTASGRPKEYPGLLEKWHHSYQALKDQGPVVARLITNRRPAPEIGKILEPSGVVDFARITDASVRDRLVQLTGSEEAALAFLTNFYFQLNQPELQAAEEGIYRRFEALGGTGAGFLALKDSLRSWVGRKNQPPPDGKITLPIVRQAALWRHLRSMPQDLVVPGDYILPGTSFHQNLLDVLQSQRQSCHVIVGGPGLGKSTYLSFLFAELERLDAPVVRHHYFLSAQDRTTGRLDADDIAQSLMSDLLRRYPTALSNVEQRNPDPRELERWLSVCADYFDERGQALTVILDGLDHVWRESESVRGLDLLFERLLPTKAGISVVVGTQPIEESHLPARLLRAAPRRDWHELPRLNQDAVQLWVEHHRDEWAPPYEHTRLEATQRLAEAFFRKSEGHPLLLRYALRELLDANRPVTAENVSGLPGESHRDVHDYYAGLQSRISSQGRIVLHLLAACRFPWSERDIADCLAPTAGAADLSAIRAGLREVKFLLEETIWRLRAFHSSLLVFIANQAEHAEQAERLQRLAVEWLRHRAPEHLRWAHLWLLEAVLGDDQPLRAGPDRPWLVSTLAVRRSRAHTSEILGRAAWASLNRGDLGRWCELGLWRAYHGYIQENGSDAGETMLPAQLILADEPGFRARLSVNLTSLSDAELVAVAQATAREGDDANATRCYAELVDRLFKPRRAHPDQEPALLHAVFTVAAMTVGGQLDEILRFVAKLNLQGMTLRRAFAVYVRNLRRQRAVSVMQSLLRRSLNAVDLTAASREAVLLACEEEANFGPQFLALGEAAEPLLAIYAQLRPGSGLLIAESLRLPHTSLLGLPKHELYLHGSEIEDLFHRAFFGFLANHLHARTSANEAWLRLDSAHAWPRRFLKRLNGAAADIANVLVAGNQPPFATLYRLLADTPPPGWEQDVDGYQYVVESQRSLVRISYDLAALDRTSSNRRIDTEELRTIVASPYCRDVQGWIKTYLSQQTFLLEPSGVNLLLEHQRQALDGNVEHFPERSRACAVLAHLAAAHGCGGEARSWLIKAAENALAYGEHKDLMLDGVLNLLQSCHEADVDGARMHGWLVSLAPVISAVLEYTDGDETSHVRAEYAALLAEAAPDLLLPYHAWQIAQGKYDAALQVFHVYLKSADLTSELTQAVIATAVDRDSLLILADRAARNDPGAPGMLASLQSYLGILPQREPPAPETRSPAPNDYLTQGQPPPPSPADFPPPEIHGYLVALQPSYPMMEWEAANRWFAHWQNTDLGRAALDALEAGLEEGISLRDYDTVFNYALGQKGKTEAWMWLTRAQRERHGWLYYMSGKEEARARWDRVANLYPTRWLEFIQKSVGRKSTEEWRGMSAFPHFVRVGQFCLRMNQPEAAIAVLEKAIAILLELVSPALLPCPPWS